MTLDDVLKQIDANALGELLRAVVFKDHGEGEHGNWNYGCYTTFDLIPEAQVFDIREREEYWYSTNTVDPGPPYDERLEFAKEAAEMGQGCSFDLDGYQIEMFYYWDGDGTLSFRIKSKDEILAHIENTDCKKPYEWRHVVS